MADWETNSGVVKDNWDDEADDGVKDAWDDEEEAPPPPPTKPDPKKTTATVASKTKEVKEMTEEEKKDAQMKADLDHTAELFGLEKSLDEFSIETKEDLKDYVNRFNARMSVLTKKPLYFDFVEELSKTLSQSFNSDQLKKLSNSLKTLSDLKLAEERANKPKDAKKTKKAPKIKMEANRIKGDFDEFLKDTNRVYDEEDDDDSFM